MDITIYRLNRPKGWFSENITRIYVSKLKTTLEVISAVVLTLLLDEVLLIAGAVEGAGVVGHDPAPQHPFGLRDRVS